MKVLSLFDGAGMAREALEVAGIPVEAYFASELDQYAIAVARENHPDIVHIGDVRNVDGNAYTDIDLLIGGSPCQGFTVDVIAHILANLNPRLESVDIELEAVLVS